MLLLKPKEESNMKSLLDDEFIRNKTLEKDIKINKTAYLLSRFTNIATQKKSIFEDVFRF
jgi:hypothetical protein